MFGNSANTAAVSKEILAEPCVIWPESYCFTVTDLDKDNTYDFRVSWELFFLGDIWMTKKPELERLGFHTSMFAQYHTR